MSKAKPFSHYLKDLRVPFVAAWEHEPPAIQIDPTVGVPAAFTGMTDHRAAAIRGNLGRPELGKMAPQRQRYCMVYGLCQVCGEKLTHAIELGALGEWGPDKLRAFDEPPCCPACALTAIMACPFAKRQYRECGGLIIGAHKLYQQRAIIKKGDPLDAILKGHPLDRATYRRWLEKPLVMHMRLQPTNAAHIQGADGLDLLKELAAHG